MDATFARAEHALAAFRNFRDALDAVLPGIALDEECNDAAGRFASGGLDALRSIEALAAPLPISLGGLGLGTEPGAAETVFESLRRIGRASVSLGRVFEGHVNAVRLVVRYGTAAQAARAADDARDGHLFGIWATDDARGPARLAGGRVTGRKAFASAAAAVTRALVTAADETGEERLVLLPRTLGEGVDGRELQLHGARGAGTRAVLLDQEIGPDDRIGAAGDYMRQPEISLGSWRPLAVQLGALEALVEAVRTELGGRRRDADPHQRARIGRLLIAGEGARLWVHRAALLAEAADAGADAADYVKLARVAVEEAAMAAIATAQRAAGLAALVRPHPIERLCRDLATYLRQPALDMVLDEAVAGFAGRAVP